MEAVPRLPMLSFKSKQSAEPPTSFNNLKLFIAELYQEDPDSYNKEVHDLETLRNVACRPSHDMDGCMTLKRYYCQLNSLLHRFPLLTERPLLTFSWRDAYSNTVVAVAELRHEMAVILYNTAALHIQLGTEEARTTADSMKLACTHFQNAAGALDMFKEHGSAPEMNDLCSDVILFVQRVCLAQAQECILEKSVADQRKPAIVAKVASQIVSYYNSAQALLIASGDDGLVADVVGSKQYKEWKKYLSFKISYLSAILYMYQGLSAEEEKKHGERVTLCQLAADKLEEAKKEIKGIIFADEVQKAITAAQEIVEAKKKTAKSENDFIYHEPVPDISTISAVQGANLVNGIKFSVTDGELLGTDIFHRLIPMKAHEGSSLYSEEKAQLLRSIGGKIEDRDAELNGFMSSLNMEFLQQDQSNVTRLPQAIVDRCASLNARPNAIPDLVALMSQLAENCGDVELQLKEIKRVFAEEEVQEKSYQQTMGQRPTVHLSELNREYQKYQEAHNKAGESNETLRKAMGLHVANLRTLSKPMTEIQAMVPTGNKAPGDENPHFAELGKLLNKVTEMRGQRTQLVNQLREAINSDDITSKIVAWGDGDMSELFRQEMAKHQKTAQLIEMNLVAQGNILKALTECYAKCASSIKQMSDTKHKRDQFYSALVASYDVYEDLLGKSTKGLEFYKKLHTNVAKLMTRVKAARDVQSEERQQRLNSTIKAAPVAPAAPSLVGGVDQPKMMSTTPKLRDYMRPGGGGFIPSIRPSPLGSENTTTTTCGTSTATDKFNSHTMNVAAPVTGGQPASTMSYSRDGQGFNNNYNQQGQYGNYEGYTGQVPITTGYVNPIYQQGGYSAAAVAPQRQQQNTVSNFSYPTAGGSSSVPSSAASPAVNNPTLVTGAGHSNAYVSSSYAVNPTAGYNQQYSQSYSMAPVTTASNNNYAVSQPYSGTATTTATNTGISSQYVGGQQSYQTPTNAYAGGSQSSSSGMSSYSTGNSTGYSNQYSNTGGNVAPSTATNQSYGGYPGYSVPPSSQQQSGGGGSNVTSSYNQYNNPTGSYATPVVVSSSDIPQVAQQMSQMNIATTTTGTTSGGYSNYYTTGGGATVTNNPSQYSTGNHAGYVNNYSKNATNQSYYDQGQATAGTGQYAEVTGTGNQYSAAVNYNTGSYDQQNVQYGQNVVGNSQYGGGENTQYSGVYQGGQSQNNNNNQVYANPVATGGQNYQPAEVAPSQSNSSPTVPPPTVSQVVVKEEVAPKVVVPPPVVNSRNMDLLSGIDFAAPVATLPEPMLQPKLAGSVVASVEDVNDEKKPPKSIIDDDVVSVLMDDSQPPPSAIKMDHIKTFLMSAQQQQQLSQSQASSPSLMTGGISDRKMSMDNISVCSEISSIDQNFDWESVSIRNESIGGAEHENILSKFAAEDPKAIKYFHGEMERLEKFLEGVNIKTLNGSTPLDKKWQELQNLLAKDAGKRTTNVAKLFPEKNKAADCIPFDHARVQLPTATDDYVNACFVRELGSNCPPLILAQTPMQNTNKDFWHMVWSQKCKLIVCLHTPAEMMHPFWPTKVNEEMHFDDFSVTLLKQFDLSNTFEYSLKLTMLGSDVVQELSALQLKSWSQTVASQVVSVAQDVITSYKQRVAGEGGGAAPIAISCLTGSKRSPLVAVAVAAVLATKAKRPLLINLVDAWFRIAAQRRGVLANEQELEFSFQVLLSNGHDLLNKNGIMTPYQVKNAQKAAVIAKEQIKDPLSELDALWKMKK